MEMARVAGHEYQQVVDDDALHSSCGHRPPALSQLLSRNHLKGAHANTPTATSEKNAVPPSPFPMDTSRLNRNNPTKHHLAILLTGFVAVATGGLASRAAACAGGATADGRLTGGGGA